MKKQNRTACKPINADYYAGTQAQVDASLADANLWLGQAAGVTRVLGDALAQGAVIANGDLAGALRGVAALISLGRCSTQHAYRTLSFASTKRVVC